MGCRGEDQPMVSIDTKPRFCYTHRKQKKKTQIYFTKKILYHDYTKQKTLEIDVMHFIHKISIINLFIYKPMKHEGMEIRTIKSIRERVVPFNDLGFKRSACVGDFISIYPLNIIFSMR